MPQIRTHQPSEAESHSNPTKYTESLADMRARLRALVTTKFSEYI